LQDRDNKRNQSLDVVWLCQVRMLIKAKFFQHQLCLFSPGNGHLQKNGII